MPVMLKSVRLIGGHHELNIAQIFSSPGVRGDSRNHCVPVLEILKLPGTFDCKLIVMPLLRPFNDPCFRTYGEFVAFFTQICEVSHRIKDIG